MLLIDQMTAFLNTQQWSEDNVDNKLFETLYPQIKKTANSHTHKLNPSALINPTVLVNQCDYI